MTTKADRSKEEHNVQFQALIYECVKALNGVSKRNLPLHSA